MEATKTIWFNGDFVDWEDAKLHVVSHTLHYGAGAFEGIRAYKTEQGTAVFRLKEHIDRFFYSTQSISLKMPFSPEVVYQACLDLLARNKLEQGYLRPLAYFGYGVMCVCPATAPVDVAIACWPWGAYLPHEMVDLKISRYPRIPPEATITDAKLCGNYLNGVLATFEIQNTKYHEVLLLDSKGNIAEGSGENIFFVKDGKIFTPQLGAILPGITRATVMQIAQDLSFEVVEKEILPTEAFQAEEAFFTGTAAEVTPIRSINDNVLGNGKVGPVSAKIKETYLNAVYGRDSSYSSYLHYVK